MLIALKWLFFTLAMTGLLVLAARSQQQQAPLPRAAVRIESYTWSAERNEVTWRPDVKQVLPDGTLGESVTKDCRILLGPAQVICNGQTETLTPRFVHDLEFDIEHFVNEIRQVSVPVIWGERAGPPEPRRRRAGEGATE